MDNKLIYNSEMKLGTLLDHLERGETVHCPRCGSALVAAIDSETVARLKVHPGIYCSNELCHAAIYIETKRPAGYWDKFKK